MIVDEFESSGVGVPIYKYSVAIDTLQISNMVRYKLMYGVDHDNTSFNKFMNDFDDLSIGLPVSDAVVKANEFLGKVGLPDAYTINNKESLWVS